MENLIIFSILLAIGFFVGRQVEANHFKSLVKRESELRHLPSTSYLKNYPANRSVERSILVQGQVVISIDFFKKTVAMIINLFGGNLVTYESLVERARREAILRLKESCQDADEVINLRIETSSITKGDNNIGSIEVLAYGTAIYLKK